ncbi:MAG: hypothetical protein VCC20_09985 [Myxococcota bacterium]
MHAGVEQANGFGFDLQARVQGLHGQFGERSLFAECEGECDLLYGDVEDHVLVPRLGGLQPDLTAQPTGEVRVFGNPLHVGIGGVEIEICCSEGDLQLAASDEGRPADWDLVAARIDQRRRESELTVI